MKIHKSIKRVLLICLAILFLLTGISYSEDNMTIFITQFKDRDIQLLDPRLSKVQYELLSIGIPKEEDKELCKIVHVSDDEIEISKSYCILKNINMFDRNNRYITPDLNFVYLNRFHPDSHTCNIQIVTHNLLSNNIVGVKIINLNNYPQRNGDCNYIGNSFSSDGMKLLCTIFTEITDSNANSVFYLNNSHCIQTDMKTISPYLGNYFGWNPRISPNGRYVISHLSYKLAELSSIDPGNIFITDTYNSYQPDNVINTFSDLPGRQYFLRLNSFWNETWSPDSSKILFVRRHNSGRGTVSIVDIHTKAITTILDLKSVSEGWNPYLEWTEKGIVITCLEEGIFYLPTGKKKFEKISLPKNLIFLWNGRLSPDGKKILFFAVKEKITDTKPTETFLCITDLKSGITLEKSLEQQYNLFYNQGTWVYPDRPSFLRNE